MGGFLRPMRLALVIVGLALVLPASASAQATRTWVSGVGDDANPCSRTAPCKTFAGAISKTASKGEINTLDPGGFGGVTITKPITIRSIHAGGVLVSGTNAIVINAASTDSVRLIGLDINGLGTGLNGVRILQAKSVRIEDSEIYGFVRNGIDHEPSNNPSKLIVENTDVDQVAGNAVLNAPATGGRGKVSIRDSSFFDSGCGVTAASFGPDPAFNFASNCGTLTSGTARTALVNLFDTLVSDNATHGVFANGSLAEQRLGGNMIVGNGGDGLRSLGSGDLVSFGTNAVSGNANNGNPTTAVALK